jgi:hypothetical protein
MTTEPTMKLALSDARNARNLLWLCGPTDRCIFPALREKLASVWHEIIQQVGYDIARSNCIDTNAIWNIFNRKYTGELRESAFRSGVRSNFRETKKAPYDPIFTIAPLFFGLMTRTASREWRNAPVRFTGRVLFHSFQCQIQDGGYLIFAALFIRISSFPKSSFAHVP